jgi:hypothetical protein
VNYGHCYKHGSVRCAGCDAPPWYVASPLFCIPRWKLLTFAMLGRSLPDVRR